MLSRKQLQQQEKLNNLNTTSLRLIPVLAEFTDIDGLIHTNENEIEKLGYMTPRLVSTAIDGLIRNGWVKRDDKGNLYSLYTCRPTNEGNGFHYINLYKFFKKIYLKRCISVK